MDRGISPGGVWLEDIAGVEQEIATVKDTVKKINLENQQGCTEVPPILLKCPRLEELNLRFTPIKEIPAFVFSLPRLRSLKYDGYSIGKQPEGFAGAQNLTTLEIGVKNGQEIPSEIFLLPKLRSLCLNGHEGITELPQAIGNLKNLTELKIKETRVFTLPESTGKLRHLKKLVMGSYFSGDHPLDLDALVQTLAPCALEDLELRNYFFHGHFTQLPLLPGLKRLYLEYIQPDGEIMDAVCKLSALKKLYLYGSSLNIKKLPPAIGDLQNLTELSVIGNFFRDIPPSLYSLKKLKLLDLGGCGIKELSEAAVHLSELRTLILDDNCLQALPDSLASMENLRYLNLSRNNFSTDYLKQTRQTLRGRAALHGRAGLPPVKLRAKNQQSQIDLKKFQDAALSPIDSFTAEEYFALALAAAKEGPGTTMNTLDPDRNPPQGQEPLFQRLSGEQYAKVCLEAVKNSGLVLEKVAAAKIDDSEKYLEICLAAVSQRAESIKYAKTDHLSPEQYKKLCFAAVDASLTWAVMENIADKKLSRDDYLEVCRHALAHKPLTVLRMKDPPPEFWLQALAAGAPVFKDFPPELKTPEVCRLAVEKDKSALAYVPEALQARTKAAAGLK
jgi:hypothetical protein